MTVYTHLETVGVLIFSLPVSDGCLRVGEKLAHLPARYDVMKCEENKSRCENAAFLPSVRLSVELADGGIQSSTFKF